MRTFAGKTVLITGASEGIGVRSHSSSPAEGRQSRARRAQRGTPGARRARVPRARRQVETVAVDVTRREDCRDCVARAVQRFGGLDALVNNAGITMWARFDAVSDFSVYERLLAVNYLGAVHMTAAALPQLKASRGLIVAIASIAGLTGVPERTGYAASKHAMVGFFESLRIELIGSGVDVTIIAPDFVVSQIHRRATGADGKPLGHTPDAGGAHHDLRAVRALIVARRCAAASACSSPRGAGASGAGRGSWCRGASISCPRARSASGAESHSKAIAGRSRAMRKYSNRYWMTRSWLCRR